MDAAGDGDETMRCCLLFIGAADEEAEGCGNENGNRDSEVRTHGDGMTCNWTYAHIHTYKYIYVCILADAYRLGSVDAKQLYGSVIAIS